MANGTGENLPSKLLQQLIALFTSANTAQGATTDAPLAGETPEGATARTGISLWKRMVNKLIEIKALLAFGGAPTDAAASSTVAEDGTARTSISLWKGIKNILILIKSALDTIIAPAAFTNLTATVAQAASESGEVDTGGAGTLWIYPPAAIEATTAQISFKTGHTTGTRVQAYDDYGVKITIPFTVGTSIKLPADKILGARFVSIVCETAAGVAVAQATAARAFILVTRRV